MSTAIQAFIRGVGAVAGAPTARASRLNHLDRTLHLAGVKPLPYRAVKAHMDKAYMAAMANAPGLARLLANHPVAVSRLNGFAYTVFRVTYASLHLASAALAITVMAAIATPWASSGDAWMAATVFMGAFIVLCCAAFVSSSLGRADAWVSTTMWRRTEVDEHTPMPWHARRDMEAIRDQAKRDHPDADLRFYVHSLGQDPFLEAELRTAPRNDAGRAGDSELCRAFTHGWDGPDPYAPTTVFIEQDGGITEIPSRA